MKRVAIIGADFAPSSLPPALRIRYFAQHLAGFGWKPVVITTDPKHYNWSVDAENERLLPASLEIIRTHALPEKLTRKIGIGDIGARSMWYHWKELARLCSERRVDLLFIPVPPFFPMILGRLAHMRFGIPYVIDFIDPWVTEYYWSVPKEKRPPKWAMSYALSRVLEPFSLKKVAHIVGVSKGTTDGIVARYKRLTEEDATEIPYGGEAGDFDYLQKHPRPNKIFNPEDGLFHISYIGAYPVGMEATVRALFKAVKLGLERSPEKFSRLRLHFIGTTYGANGNGPYQLKPIARELGIEELVDEHPARVSYLDALQLQLDSNALAIIGSDAPHYTASKIFPYILSQKPLLTIFHEESSVVKILEETRAGDVVSFSSETLPEEKIGDIRCKLEELLARAADYRPPTCWQAFEKYTTREMARRLAAVFDNASGAQCSRADS